MSRFLTDEWRQMKDALAVKFYTDLIFQLTAADQEAVRQALQMIKQVRKYKSCHYVCCALYQSGVYKCGTHVYSRRSHEFSICAEHRPIERAHFKTLSGNPDPIITIATFHAGHDHKGQYVVEPYLASPCQKCCRLLDQESPDCLIVADIDGAGRLAKIPIEAVEFFRHPRKHNGE